MAIHSDLARKLKLLYELRLNSEISSHTDLAKHLSISKQAVSRWIHGCETRRGDRIPGAQLNRISNLFRIPEYWLALPYVGFEDVLFKKLEDQEGPTVPRPERISISQLPTTSSVVFGRESELEILKTAWRQKTANVVQIVAFGGVGKSCLTNYWLAYLNEHNYLGAKQIYAWSFYWQGASSDIKSSGDFFIEHALEWFGDTDSSKGTPWAKANRLAKLIRESRTLLILDGLEPLQCSPGPNIGAVENPAVSFLIKELACENNGLCIITSRLPVLELVAFKGKRIVTVLLKDLSPVSSIELLVNLGIQGSNDEILKAVKKYSCHPLSLTLLAGYLRVVYQGSIQKIQELRSLLDEQRNGEHARHIMHAYLKWFENRPERQLLFLIGLASPRFPRHLTAS